MRRYSEALRRLTRSTPLGQPDLDRALAEIVEVAAETLEVARASIWLYDQERTSVRCQDLYDRKAGTHQRGLVLRSADYPAYFRALDQERSIAAGDAHVHPATREFSAGYLTPFGIHAMLDAPIFCAARMVGVVCHEHTGAPREWKVEEEQFAGSIADVVALALEASKLRQAEKDLQSTVEQLRRRLRQVRAMVELSASVISVLDVEQVLEEIIDLSREVMSAEASTLLLLDREGGKLRFHAARGSAVSKLKGATVELGRGLSGYVARTGEPLLVADAYQDPRFAASYDRMTGFKTRSIMTVPLKTKADVLGVLQVMNKAGGEAFNQEDLELFQSFACLGAISLENARLFGQTRKMAEDLRDALEKERRLAIEKEKMGAYVPRHVVDEISRNREKKLALGGKTVEATVLFSDIKGFTLLSETMKPQDVVTYLNEYMTAMANIIEEEAGLVDKFIGDGIMAVFLPRKEGDDHALRAVRTGIRMQQRLRGLKERWETERPQVARLQMRCGINSGEMVAGNVGSETRMEYTVIGDNVNVASRIESHGVGGEVHISRATHEAVRGSIKATRLEPIKVKNRVEAVEVYSVEIPDHS